MSTGLYHPQSHHELNPFREGATIPVSMSALDNRGIFEDRIREIVGDRRILTVKRDMINRQYLVVLYEDKEQADRWENDFGYLYRI